jgi:hypothetical protein
MLQAIRSNRALYAFVRFLSLLVGGGYGRKSIVLPPRDDEN